MVQISLNHAGAKMKKIADIKTDFSQWYQDVIFEAELVDSSPTRGSMVFRPYGYEIWENIQTELNKRIKEGNYFPFLKNLVRK